VIELRAGAWAASLTPLNENLSIDTGAYVDHVVGTRCCAAPDAIALTRAVLDAAKMIEHATSAGLIDAVRR
jgi:hypothetical protein